MAKVSAANIKCQRCGCEKFIIGSTFPQAGGNMGYTLRCASCFDRRGDSSYVQNVSQPAIDLLMNQGRIVAEPLKASPANKPTPANPADAYPPAYSPAYGASQNTGISSHTSETLGTAMPPAFRTGRTMQPANDPMPFDSDYDEEMPPPPPFIQGSEPMSVPAPTAASVSNVAPAPAATNTLAPNVQELCVACSRGLAVRIPSSKYVARIQNASLVCSDETSGAILFTQQIAFCPFCGRKLK